MTVHYNFFKRKTKFRVFIGNYWFDLLPKLSDKKPKKPKKPKNCFYTEGSIFT